MEVPGQLIGVYAKIERAKEHIHELESEIQRFKESDPYKVVRDQEPDTEDWVFRLRVHSSLPLRCNAIVGDIIHNLRSSLDNLAWQLVLANGGKPTKQTAFPISDSADEFEATGLRKVKGASDEAKKLIKRLIPYRGGSDAFWRLHQLSIVDKHRLMATVGGAHENVIIDFSVQLREIARRAGFDWVKDIPPMKMGLRPANRQYPLVDGTELYRIKAGVDLSQVDMNPKFTLQVAFGQGGVVRGEPILPTLRQLVGCVEEAVKLFHPFLPQNDIAKGSLPTC